MTAAAFLTSANPQPAIPADCIVEPSAAGISGQAPVTGVGQNRLDHSAADDERESHISSCTYLMEAAYARYEASSCFNDRAEADRWRMLRDEAVKARSAAQVRRMELERGIA